MECKNHPNVKSVLRCVKCNNSFCEECVKVRQYENFTAYVCKECGGKCEEIDLKRRKLNQAGETSKTLVSFSFWGSIPRIFIYPFLGKGRMLTIVGTLAFSLLAMAFMIPFGWIFTVILSFYILALLIKIIEVSAFFEDEEYPDWPSIKDCLDWLGMAFLWIIATVMCYGPAFYYFMRLSEPNPLFWVVLAVGFYIHPMCILAVSLTRAVSSLNPFVIFISAFKTFIPYTITFLLWIIFSGMCYLVDITPLMSIPLFGQILKWFTFTYFIIINMRLLGIFYCVYKEELNWFADIEPVKSATT